MLKGLYGSVNGLMIAVALLTRRKSFLLGLLGLVWYGGSNTTLFLALRSKRCPALNEGTKATNSWIFSVDRSTTRSR